MEGRGEGRTEERKEGRKDIEDRKEGRTLRYPRRLLFSLTNTAGLKLIKGRKEDEGRKEGRKAGNKGR